MHALPEKDIYLLLVLGMYKKENGRNFNLANPLFVLASRNLQIFFFFRKVHRKGLESQVTHLKVHPKAQNKYFISLWTFMWLWIILFPSLISVTLKDSFKGNYYVDKPSEEMYQ